MRPAPLSPGPQNDRDGRLFWIQHLSLFAIATANCLSPFLPLMFGTGHLKAVALRHDPPWIKIVPGLLSCAHYVLAQDESNPFLLRKSCYRHQYAKKHLDL